jgi:hypothetical protein
MLALVNDDAIWEDEATESGVRIYKRNGDPSPGAIRAAAASVDPGPLGGARPQQLGRGRSISEGPLGGGSGEARGPLQQWLDTSSSALTHAYEMDPDVICVRGDGVLRASPQRVLEFLKYAAAARCCITRRGANAH